ncbi:MAG: tRNA preQ1(34) S-adenosylmethionine ribosyltransferase-isomerase QueA [Candidatus Zixiibacteriota bacterium]
MDLSLFDYHLPSELIAQRPADSRSDSRLMILNRQTGETVIRRFTDLITCLNPGDCLVINDTRVFPARLLGGRRTSGGAVEILLVRPTGDMAGSALSGSTSPCWLALARPSARLKPGESILYVDSHGREDSVELLRHVGEGVWEISFTDDTSARHVIDTHGAAPLPPYIQRQANDSDIERYQTVYADRAKVGAVAAPTAGLHFTLDLLEKIRLFGVHVIPLTLHVGPGTFKPVTAAETDEHVVDPEWAELSEKSASVINRARANGGAVVAVGTTVVRALESAARVEPASDNAVAPFAGMVDLFIQPGFEFKIVDKLLTNFHLPKSSLLLLASAFAGRELLLKRYAQAASEGLRFYSYGDCMLIHGSPRQRS